MECQWRGWRRVIRGLEEGQCNFRRVSVDSHWTISERTAESVFCFVYSVVRKYTNEPQGSEKMNHLEDPWRVNV